MTMTKDEYASLIRSQDWEGLLREAVNKPGIISKAYSMFHNYSIGNKMLALWQCLILDIEPGPMAGYKKWQELGRQVQKGSRKLYLWIPMMKSIEVENEETGELEKVRILNGFDLRPCVFVISQTEGDEVEFPEVADFDRAQVMETFGISDTKFDYTDGNVQGFARDGKVAINPLAEHKFKTWIHEVAHNILEHTSGNGSKDRRIREVEGEGVALIVNESLGLPGADESRGYIQSWWGSGNEIPESSARKIFSVANKILEAGLVSEDN
jgi:hypothetical protein